MPNYEAEVDIKQNTGIKLIIGKIYNVAALVKKYKNWKSKLKLHKYRKKNNSIES